MRTEDKIYIAELRKLIATKTGKNEQETNVFLNSLFAHITDGLIEDNSVRINGLGTFKLQKNEPRKSVNVSTGEPIIIEGYNKAVFIPEEDLKHKINLPFANEKAILLEGTTKEDIDPLEKLNEQALEISNLLSEINIESSQEEQTGEIEESTQTDLQNDSSVEDNKQEEDKTILGPLDEVDAIIKEIQATPKSTQSSNSSATIPIVTPIIKELLPDTNEEKSTDDTKLEEVVEEINNEPQSNEHTAEDTTPIIEQEDSSIIEEVPQTNFEQEENIEEPEEEPQDNSIKEPIEQATEPIIESTNTISTNKPIEQEGKEQKREKPFHPWRVAGITILIFCLLLIGAFFYLRHGITSWCEKMLDKINRTENFDTVLDQSNIYPKRIEPAIMDSLNTADSIQEETTNDSIIENKENTISLSDTLAVVKLNEGSRLSQLARRYYKGNYHMWVYIYLANKDVLVDPDIIPSGQKIVIPSLPESVIDLNNQEEIQKADSLQNTILK